MIPDNIVLVRKQKSDREYFFYLHDRKQTYYEKLILLSWLLPLIFPALCNAQNKIAIQWAKTYGGSGSEQGGRLVRGINGGYVFVGAATTDGGDVSGSHGMYDAWVVATDDMGHLSWQKCLGGSDNDHGACISATEGGYIVAGSTASSDGDVTYNHGGISDAWVMKLSVTGSLLWQKTYGGSGWDFVLSITPTLDGGYIFTGGTTSTDGDVSGYHVTPTSPLQPDMWVVKIDDTGKVQWQKCLGGTNGEEGVSILQLKDSSYAIAGVAFSTDGDVTGHHDSADVWIVKLKPNGALDWAKCYGGSSYDAATCIRQTNDGGFIVGCSTSSHDGDLPTVYTGNCWVLKLSAAGAIEWQHTYGGSRTDAVISIRQTYDSAYIFSGYTNSDDGDVHGWHSSTPPSKDMWVVRLNKTGSIRWQKCLGGSSEDGGGTIIQVADSEFTIVGSTGSNDGDVMGQHGSGLTYDAWLVNIKEEDTTTAVTMPGRQQNNINVYPNPATEQITITHAAGLQVVIDDVTGRQVLTVSITKDRQTVGLKHLPAGSYYISFYNKAHQLMKGGKLLKE